MPDSEIRPARSNSFQRMLELERQYMLERLQASTPQPANRVPPPSRHPASPARSAASASIQVRRAEVRPPRTPAEARRHGASPASRPAPLVINTTSTSTAKSRPEAPPLYRQRQGPAMGNAPPAVPPPADKPNPKIVSFEFPPRDVDQRSICVSPSWEAHGRRKKEKKMMERKEKEEAAKKADSRGRKGRLSKQPPPASSTYALGKAEAATSDSTRITDPRGRQNERPSIPSSPKSPGKDATPTKSRSRSSSFASLIRSPFEFRRSSVGHAPESQPEFIGGIKLELERHLAHEQALNQQAKADEATADHPLPKDIPNQRWSAPLKSPPPPARGSADARDPSRRAYPPITRHGNAPKPRSLVSPTAPAIPDLRKIDRWRARVGLRPTSQADKPYPDKPSTEPDAQVDHIEGSSDAGEAPRSGSTTEEAAAATTSEPAAPPTSQVVTTELPTTEVTTEVPTTDVPTTDVPTTDVPTTDVPTTDVPTTEADAPLNKRHGLVVAQTQAPKDTVEDKNEARDSSHTELIDSNPHCRSNPSTELRTAPSTPPPEPPRRSPKRSSLYSLDGSVSHLHGAVEPTETLGAPAHSDLSAPAPRPTTPKKKDEAASAISDSFSTKPMTPKAADLSKIQVALHSPSHSEPKAAVARSMSSMPWKPVNVTQNRLAAQVTSSTRVRPMPTSSSEDSCSEELHSPSPPSTPATSRPQSEKGIPLLSGGDRAPSVDATMSRPPHDGGSDAARGSDGTDGDDTRDIQAAADKVLAAFCEATADSPDMERHSDSDSTLGASQKPPSVPQHQPLRPRDKGTLPHAITVPPPAGNQPWRNPLSREQSPRPAPATYLEEARRGLPAAPLSRWSKQRLGPPASFTLPGDAASPMMHPEASRSSDTVGRSLRHTSTPSLGQLEREPMAKVFVECCGCRFFHDMPSNLYEAMANPEGVLSRRDTLGYAGSISMTVKCPWCRHEMSTKCCAGLAAMVYVTERLH